jgi:Fur family transcriptional regulator, zinc uptake regulator
MIPMKNVSNLIHELETYCKENGARYTPPRRMVLEVIASSSKPMGAYDVLKEMEKIMSKPKPTTVYRAIEFLQAHGFIHKIESLSAFISCHAGHAHGGSQFIVCNDCGTVKEIHLCHLPQSLAEKVQEAGFHMDHWNTEIHGRCKSCLA